MTVYVCKMCGRAVKAPEKPNFCYFDCMDSIENIGDEDAVRMQLFSTTRGIMIGDAIYEFGGDIKYDIMTGMPLEGIEGNDETLVSYQETMMRDRVWGQNA